MNETCASSQNAAYPKQAMPPPTQQGYQWPAGGGEAHVPPSYPSGYSSPFNHQQQYVSLTYGKIEKKKREKNVFFLIIVNENSHFFGHILLTMIDMIYSIFVMLQLNSLSVLLSIRVCLTPTLCRGPRLMRIVSKSSLSAIHASTLYNCMYKPLLKKCLQFFWLFFWVGYCCLTLKQRARIMVDLEHPTFQLRGGDVITSPLLMLFWRNFEKF